MPIEEGGGGIKTVWKRGRRMEGIPRGEGGGMKTDCRSGMSMGENCPEEKKKISWRRRKRRREGNCLEESKENCLEEREVGGMKIV